MITNNILKLHNLFGRPLILVQQETILQLFIFELETKLFVSLGRFFKLAHVVELIVLLQVFRGHFLSLTPLHILYIYRGFLRAGGNAQRRLDAVL